MNDEVEKELNVVEDTYSLTSSRRRTVVSV